ncbi:MAG: ATP-binding protein [Gammaproteobacteria bacterium]|nr:ATP-binding protein [Gammaproteobacteria bacterium]
MSAAPDPPAENHGAIKRRRIKLLTTISIILIVYLLGAYGGVLPEKTASWWPDLFWTAAALAAGWRCLHTAKTRTVQHERVAWNLFGFAALSWFTGMLIWDFYEIAAAKLVPFPSLADWFFLGYPVLCTAGLLYYRTQIPTRQHNMIQVANLGLIVCTIIVSCFIVLSQALQQSDHPLDYQIYALSNSILNFVCFVFGVYCYWFYVWRENRRSFRLMLLALFIFAFTDTLYAFHLLGKSYDAASYFNIYWLIAFALQYWAAVEQDGISQIPSRETDDRKIPRAQKYEAIMPALCLFTVLAFTLYFRDRLNDVTSNVMAAAAVAFAFFLTLREWYSNRLEKELMKEVQAANLELEQRVLKRTAELSDAILELESFSYSVSHDLRAPLRTINGFSLALHEDYIHLLDDTGKDYLHRIRTGTQKMSDLIDALLKLSRVSRHTIQHQPVPLDKLAEGIIQQFREQEPGRNVNVAITKNVLANGDEYLLRIVLENLLSNAWKYTSKTENAQIEFGGYEQNNENIFYVKDNGVGFDMQYYNKLFNAFQRLHGEEFEGTGIGLATVARCIRRHNGRIWGESAAGGGAAFYFTLPPAVTRPESETPWFAVPPHSK